MNKLSEFSAPACTQNRPTELQRILGIQDHYTYQVRHWVTWMQDNSETVNEESVKRYFRFLRETDYSAGTIRNKRQAVKKRLRQLYQGAPVEDQVKLDRVLYNLDHETETKAPKVNSDQVTIDRVIDAVEYRHLLRACRSARQRLFIEFLWTTGCRVSEMTGIKLRNCESMGDAYKVRVMGKGSKERFVRIPAELFGTIWDTFQGKTYLFETTNGKPYQRSYVSNQIKKIGKLIGRKISAHSLRHSFATRKVQQFPAKLEAVSRYLGHSSTSITLNMYVHTELSNDELFSVAV